MKRFARSLLVAFTALSAITLITSLTLWIGRPRTLYRGRTQAHEVILIHSASRYLHLMTMQRDPFLGEGFGPSVKHRFAGALWMYALGTDRANCVTDLFVPLWLIALLGLPLPTVGLLRWRRRVALARRAAVVGRCRACLYDLTANVSGYCPECGAKV